MTPLDTTEPSLPLCELVRIAVDNYFEQLDGEPVSGLHGMVIQEVEKPLIEAVLVRSASNQSKASQILGISRGTLRKKMAEYGLD